MLRDKSIRKAKQVELLNIIKAYKKEHKLTVRELAEEFGIKRELMSAYLNGYFDIPSPPLFAGILTKHQDLIDAMHEHILANNK